MISFYFLLINVGNISGLANNGQLRIALNSIIKIKPVKNL